VQALLTEFRRRQRHANLLVAGSIATAILLTVVGLLIIAQMAVPRSVDGDNRPALRSTSVAWQRPVQAGAGSGLEFAVVSANRAAKGEPLLVPKFAEPTEPAAPAAQVILAASGRAIAFASLLPSSPAGYLLIRGLPATARLSAGRQSESGTWLVKGDYVSDLTLTMGEATPGDYPIEVYVLQSGDAPQARRSLVLRVEAPAQPYTYATYAPDMGWASALLDVVPAAQAAEAPAIAPADAKLLHDRAERLLQEGDIAAARLLLLHLAERGEGDAAYDLARTFDRDVLTELGAKGVEGDPESAQRWYQRAAQDGNAKATQRLKILASLSGTDPSD
jgi:TPR repeat protein